MASFSDIIKAMIENKTISNNKWLIMIIITALTGGTGTLWGMNKADSMEQEKNTAVREVAVAFQAMLHKEDPKPTVKTDNTLSLAKEYCNSLLEEHKGEMH